MCIGYILGIGITRTELLPLFATYDTSPNQIMYDWPAIPTMVVVPALIVSANPSERSILVDIADRYATDVRLRAVVTYDANTTFRRNNGTLHKITHADVTGLAAGEAYSLFINRSPGSLYVRSMLMSQFTL